MLRSILVLFLALAVTLAACSGAMNVSRSCRGNRTNYACTVSAQRISGQYTANVAPERFRQVDRAKLDLTVSVESGRVLVAFNTTPNEEVSGEARPGTPLTLSGVVDSRSDTLNVRVQALDGEATGLTVSSTLVAQ